MQRGRLERWRVEDAHVAADGAATALSGYAYLPVSNLAPSTWLVSVHGISRRAQQHGELLAPLAERLGMGLAAPRFTASGYADYQRLGRQRADQEGVRADIALIRWLDALAAHTGVPAERVLLMGFSGGAQFAHRFALAHPHRLLGCISVAAGWYTWPDVSQAFPYGAKPSRRLPGLALDMAGWLQLPIAALVGEHDTEAESALRQTLRVNAQGEHRRARGEHWVAAINAVASANNLVARTQFDVLAGAAHSFRACVETGDLRNKVAAIVQEWRVADCAT